MNRRLLILALIVVLFSTFFSLSSPGLSSPSVVHAVGCTTTNGIVGPGLSLSPLPHYALNPGDTVTASTNPPGFANVSPNLVIGGVDVFIFNPAVFTVMSYSITFCQAGGGQVTTTNFTDGRLNSHDPWETTAIYCEADGSVKVLRLAQPVWVLAFIVTPAEIAKVPKHPAKHTIIKQVGSVALYRLNGGQLQVNSPGLNPVDGIYVFRFDDCPLP